MMKNNFRDVIPSKFQPLFQLAAIAVCISFATRLILLLTFGNQIHGSFTNIISGLCIGFAFDLLISLFIILPFAIHICFTNNFIYTRHGKWIALGGFAVLLSIFLFTSIIPKDFNRDLYKGVIAYIVLRLVFFIFLYTRSLSFRLRWRTVVLKIFFFITIFLLVFNAVSEWFFWDEFSSRYNFIAVDYLIYTNEVVGNIQESYPIVSITIGVLIIALVIFWLIRKSIGLSVRSPLRFTKRLLALAILVFGIVALNFIIKPGWKNFSNNNYVNEIAANGVYEFVQAFKNNKLDFYTFYQTLPDSTAFQILRQSLTDSNSSFVSNDIFNIERQITYPGPEKKMNVVMISVESLSASFMQAFGNKNNITPFMDSLAKKGMFFTNLYASGTRTVRGLEALSLSIPPPPGQSIVKRPGNENLFSLGSVFKSKGYITQYIYGGYGYFDNMNYFFGHNDYDVIDRTALKADEIHYANIWGVADEDLFSLALREMDSNYARNKPFFSQVMTVSNHRPFTYPDGRIDIPPTTQTRDGAVKYTDYSIGQFIKQASAKPWFSNTLFIIVADHCASSAGKQALPVTGYHIPMIIYSPGNIAPQEIKTLTAQIDIAPTLLGMLNFSYKTKFFGQDIFRTPLEKQRVFISTYQGLGFLKHDTLVVQSPVKKIKTYQPDFVTGDAKEIEGSPAITSEAIAYYQAISWLIKNKKYGALE